MIFGMRVLQAGFDASKKAYAQTLLRLLPTHRHGPVRAVVEERLEDGHLGGLLEGDEPALAVVRREAGRRQVQRGEAVAPPGVHRVLQKKDRNSSLKRYATELRQGILPP